MNNRDEVREFLSSRRALVTPEQLGLPTGTNRRVKGLRRSEVATVAGVSIEYYTRMERGAISGASPEVLDSVAKALRLDDAERAHLRPGARSQSGGKAPAAQKLQDMGCPPQSAVDPRRRHGGSGFCPQWPHGFTGCEQLGPRLLSGLV